MALNMDAASQLTWLRQYVTRQLDNMFPLQDELTVIDAQVFDSALQRTCHCISRIRGTHGLPFNALNSGHCATFLYYLAHTLHRNGGQPRDATRIFLLNKALNGIDLFYEVEMPSIFVIGHTVGMVFAKATYGEECVFHQGCTVGRNEVDRPTLERGVILYPHSSVIGASLVRENSVLGPGVQLVNTDTPGNCLVFSGVGGKPIFKPIREYYASRYLGSR